MNRVKFLSAMVLQALLAACSEGSGGADSNAVAAGDCPGLCQQATACVAERSDCGVDDFDAEGISNGCMEICAASPQALVPLTVEAETCERADDVLLDNATLASGPNRDAIFDCGPSGLCQFGCDGVGYCAEMLCPQLEEGFFTSCISSCAADETWVDAVATAEDSMGCREMLEAYRAQGGDLLPPNCPPND